jgi:glycerol uptake facilitator-like aquaporin
MAADVVWLSATLLGTINTKMQSDNLHSSASTEDETQRIDWEKRQLVRKIITELVGLLIILLILALRNHFSAKPLTSSGMKWVAGWFIFILGVSMASSLWKYFKLSRKTNNPS